jgi:hypothetical protein
MYVRYVRVCAQSLKTALTKQKLTWFRHQNIKTFSLDQSEQHKKKQQQPTVRLEHLDQ